jgi:hypothetical protein
VRKLSWTVGVLATAVMLTFSCSALAGPMPDIESGPATTQTLAVYGDAPYGVDPADDSQVVATPAFIASVNADPDVSTVLHVGDIHSGKQFCTQTYDQTVFDLWTQFQDPLVYTPGDNEWSDCHKVAEGGGLYNPATGQIDYVRDGAGQPVDYAKGDPIANLDLVRSLFFPHPGVSLGTRKKLVLSQATWARFVDRSHPSDAKYVENVIFVQGSTLFVTINAPGGSNNDNDTWYGTPSQSPAQAQEIAERTGADLRWLDLAYAVAGLDRRIGSIVIGAQADMWDPEKGASHLTAYEPLVKSIADHTAAFGRPVLMFNGDSHVYQTGNPLSPANPLAALHPGYDVRNFHRVVVHGSTFPLEWLKLKIDPSADNAPGTEAFGPFSWQRMIIRP